MHNIIWFIVISLLAFLLVVLSLWKGRVPRSRLILVFLLINGISFIFEYVIKILFHSYDYYPNVLSNHWLDSLFGALISQAIIIPSVAMFIVAFQLNVSGIMGFCLLLMGIEELFLWLGIYEHNWWKTVYTGFFVFIGFFIGKWWETKLIDRNAWVDWVNIFMILTLLSSTIMYLIDVFFHYRLFKAGWFQDPVRDSVALEALFIYLQSIFVSFMIQYQIRWYWFACLYLFNIATLTILERIDRIEFYHFWRPFMYAVFPAAVAVFSYWFYNRIEKKLA